MMRLSQTTPSLIMVRRVPSISAQVDKSQGSICRTISCRLGKERFNDPVFMTRLEK